MHANLGIDIRKRLFRHLQLYISLSKTTASETLSCLVRPERPITANSGNILTFSTLMPSAD